MTTTVTTTQTLAVANGTAAISFDFQAISATEIEVLREGVVVSPATYTVNLNADGTGEITPTSTWGSDNVIIRSAPSYQQPANFERFVPVFPDQMNPPLDRLARSLLALRSYVDREIVENLADIAGEDGEDGAPGDDAEEPNFTFAINTLAPGSSNTLAVTGTYPDLLLTFGVARGDPGASGALADGTYSGIVVSNTGANLDVVAKHITLARMADMASAGVIGATAAGAPGILSFATVKAQLALNNVDNTSDLNKPISTATQAALDDKLDDVAADLFADAFAGIVSISAATTLDDATHNDKHIRLTGSTGFTITLNSTPTSGFGASIVHRGTVAAWTLSIAGGAYLNGASSTVTSITVAIGADFVVFHEGGGVWVVKGTGLS